MTCSRKALEPLAMIVAAARNRVIGRSGTLPWHIPEDLKHFKRTTHGHAVIMGRKTFDSIGKPLPGRRNIVVSATSDSFDGCEAASSLEEAIALARTSDDLPFVIGGARLFEEALPLATEIYLTRIDEDVEGDTVFEGDLGDFEEVDVRAGDDPKVSFQHLRRKR